MFVYVVVYAAKTECKITMFYVSRLFKIIT